MPEAAWFPSGNETEIETISAFTALPKNIFVYTTRESEAPGNFALALA